MTRSAYTALCADLLFPLHELAKGHDTLRRLRALEQSQWWSAERLRDAQFARLKRFLQAAADRVPYYRQAFAESGFAPERMGDASDLAKVPLLTKALIRANVDRLKAHGATALKRYNTGGSSGEPLVFYIGKDRRSHDVAAKWRATRWWDVDIGDVEIVVWGSPIELGAQDRIRQWRDRVLRTELLPAFDMSAPGLDAFVERIRACAPRMLFGYPSSLALIARHAEKRAIAMNELGIRVAFVTSERLYDDQRQTIERVFGCKVANGYGGRDAGFIAHECPAGGMHFSAEDIVVETVDPSGNQVAAGEAGEIVVTHLATGDFPFIRYRTGDVGILDQRACPCGRGLPLLAEVQGRTTDFVVASDGTIMHGLALIYVIRDLPSIEAFRIVQESTERTRVLVVPGPGFESGLRAQIEAGLRQRLGSSVDVSVELVDSLPPEPSGKFRYVQSRVAQAASAA
ncbi:MAG: phenylacetate--CoA ligase family protein [Casimicrobiaceae bacterium]